MAQLSAYCIFLQNFLIGGKDVLSDVSPTKDNSTPAVLCALTSGATIVPTIVSALSFVV